MRTVYQIQNAAVAALIIIISIASLLIYSQFVDHPPIEAVSAGFLNALVVIVFLYLVNREGNEGNS